MVEKLFFRIVSILAVSVLAVCCAKDGGTVSGGRHYLNINSVTTKGMLTKAVIDGISFPQAEAEAGIGLYLLNAADSSAYPADGCSNVRYSNSGDGWKSDAPISLSYTEGLLCGCFPYDASFADCRGIPVESSLNGTDYMYAESEIVAGTVSYRENVDLTMRHALARLSVTFVKDASYKGDGVLSSISIEGDGVAASGHLDALTGSVTAAAAPAVFTVSAGEGTIVAEGLVKECLIVPVSEADTTRQSAVLKCTIDGKEYSLTLEGDNGVVVCRGIQSNVLVSVNAGELTPVDVWAGEWGDGNGGSSSIDGTSRIYVKLEDDALKSDVLYAGYPEGTSMVIEALSKSGKALLCTVPDNCACTSTMDFETKVYKFTISGFLGDITAVLGYPHDEGVLARVEKDVTRACAKTVFIDDGWRLDNGIPINGTGGFSAMASSVITSQSYNIILTKDDNSYSSSDSMQITRAYLGREDVSIDGDLFWPDGEPRYLVYYCMGGDASNGNEHGKVLGDDCMERIRRFVRNGGSYLGSGGAGAAFAGEKLDGISDTGYLGLYPGNVSSTGNTSWGTMKIEFTSGSPLLDYMGGVKVINSGLVDRYGVYMDETNMPAGTEILARYESNAYANSGKPAVWAYKADSTRGRIVLCGSRPEYYGSSDRDKLLKAELNYAIDGSSKARIKGVLHNGETKFMLAGREDPEHCGIGGLQCHHFVVDITKDIDSLTLNLEWPNKGANLEVYLRKDHFAMPGTEDYKLTEFVGVGETAFYKETLKGLSKGLWYVTVRCSTSLDYYQTTLSDRTGLVCFISSKVSQEKKKERMASVCVPYSISCQW